MKQIAIQGICYDQKSSYLRGAALAPPLIREALYSPSSNMYSEYGQVISPAVLIDLGDLYPVDFEEISKLLDQQPHLDIPFIHLGGDHSISYPLVQWAQRRYGSFDILHIDAHGDLYDHFDGDPHSHACPFARIMENNLAERLIQLGIRTLTTHQREQAQKYHVDQVEMKNYHLKALPSLYKPIYLSLDIDVLDPAYAPGVSHHEPGGMSTRQLLEIIQSIDVPIIGADIVEYNPTRDINGMTAMVAAKCLKEIAAKMLLSN